MDAKVTISRSNRDEFTIRIDDDMSGLRVTEVTMKPDDFARCLTGLGYSPGVFRFSPKEFTVQNIGKLRETKRVEIDWRKGGDQNRLHDLIQPHLVDGWMLHSDGLSIQQPANGHVIILYRFQEPQ